MLISMFIAVGCMALMAIFGFEFPSVVDTVEGVPEKFRPLYTKNAEGKFALEKHVAGWKGLGLGETYEEAKKRLEGDDTEDDETDEGDDGEKKAKGKRGDRRAMQKIKAESEAAVAATRAEYEGKLNSVQTMLKKQMIDGEARAAIAKLKGVPDLLLPHVREKCLLIEEDGVYHVRVVDAEGDPRSDGKGGYLTIEDLVAEMRKSETYGRAFEADGTKGSGKPPGGAGGNRDGGQKLTSIQKISKGLDNLPRK